MHIKVKNITKHYRTNLVLQEMTLSFDDRLTHGLLGANGAGKSTLIKTIMGLAQPDHGDVVKPKSISLLPETPYLPENLSAFQMVRHACSVQKNSGNVSQLLEEVSLKKEAWHKPIRTYSKGMKQRTAIAYTLAGEPEWLVLDEPMSGLDAMGRKQMLDVFQTRTRETSSILMCSHAVTDLVRLCDKVHIIAEGKVCETVDIKQHSMQEAEYLETQLIQWSKNALD